MSQSQHIIIVDDEAPAREMVGDYLKMHGFTVTLCDGGKTLRSAIDTGAPPDLVVLDLNMPEEDGLSIIRDLKSRTNVPVIMLTATASPIDRVVGLEIGADDYLPKPFNPRELLARIRAILRRASPARSDGERLTAGDITLDTGAREAWINVRQVNLTSVEFSLLEEFMRHAGHVVTRDDLTQSVLGRKLGAFDRVIDVHVSNLRKKLTGGSAGERIKAVRGAGYQFVVRSETKNT